ncbi:palmitoyltransferase for Vac8p, partial [Ascosphaera aggregata]
MSLADPADTFVGIGCFILSVLAGVLGLVLTGFTAWHISLVSRNLTTIESLERTRYVIPLRDIIDQKRKEILTAWNQGLLAAPSSMSTSSSKQQQQPPPSSSSPPAIIQKRMQAQEEARGRGQFDAWQKDSASGVFSHTVDPYQQARYSPEHLYELERHYIYVDDTEAGDLPHAFDRGWRENFRSVFGDDVLRWFLPTKDVAGDGWVWP